MLENRIIKLQRERGGKGGRGREGGRRREGERKNKIAFRKYVLSKFIVPCQAVFQLSSAEDGLWPWISLRHLVSERSDHQRPLCG